VRLFQVGDRGTQLVMVHGLANGCPVVGEDPGPPASTITVGCDRYQHPNIVPATPDTISTDTGSPTHVGTATTVRKAK
jgi:hypothetical protein